MLTIKRKSRGNQLELLLQNSSPFFNRSLLLSFFLALSLHGFALLFFSILPTKYDHFTNLNPQSFVLRERAEVFKQELPIPQRHPLEPAARKPKLTEIAIPHPSLELSTWEPEEREFEVFPNFDLEPMLTKKFLFKGDLATLSCISPIPEILTKPGKGALYFVRVENRTGQIFWAESTTGSKELTKEILALRFQATDQGITEGWIEAADDD
jgi:hypothetical protein